MHLDFQTPPSQQQSPLQLSNANFSSKKKNFLKAFLLSPSVLSWFGLILSTSLVWGSLWGLLNHLALPGGEIFALVVVVVVCYIGGQIVSLLTLPPLLGMLIMGMILQNVPYIDVAKDLNPKWSSDLRSIALVIILLRAGLGLDPIVLRKLSGACFRLAFTPCIVECITIAIISHFLLEFPWLWGFILGFVIAAVSPAVVVPSMLLLEEKGLGVNKGIPTLVIAAASVDDILAITGFGVVLGITFSTGSLAWNIAKGPLEAVIGIVYGCILGWIMWFVPGDSDKKVNLFRILELLFGGMFAMFGGRAVKFGGIGALACLTLAFVAAFGWRKKSFSNEDSLVSSTLGNLWLLFQPILFGLIGTEIKFEDLKGDTVGFGIAVLLIALVFRMLTSFIVVFKAGLSLREQFFIAIAWLPKATVQAAIGPFALDLARKLGSDKTEEKLGIQVLTIAVLSILLTAPIGAAAIAVSAPRLLEKTDKDNLPHETSSYTSSSASLDKGEIDTKL
ncbi:sodium/hydrogen exchanger 9B2-like [Centruroides sculpturatus]|uniref:sodium/hydrogen exchanger 9B2-like n=1 Tax=Centruroides sculpturatus TaxID=218467 RepID=UPI000C6E5A20|nr:sodium/hydrogen exchanger 9B2-like [Centruroides sculpturatus]